MFVARLKDPKTDTPHRRLYLTMLGVCGTKDDLPLLEEMLKSEDRAMKAGLDALIGCYLTLKGAGGLPLVKDLFITNESTEFTDQYQAIMALRFHAEEGGVLKKDEVAAVLRHMLDRPKYADLVVADLARWEDWSVIDRLFELFRDADQDSLWVREPIVNYMRACPLAKAKEYLKEFEKIDPKAVKRASGFFPLGAPKTSTAADKAAPAKEASGGEQSGKQNSGEKSDNSKRTFKETALRNGAFTFVSTDADSVADETVPAGISESTPSANPSVGTSDEATPASDDVVAVEIITTEKTNSPGLLLLVGVPVAAGLAAALLVFFLASGTRSTGGT
jgi:hypothetical protein